MIIGTRIARGCLPLAFALSGATAHAENALAAKYGCLGCHASATRLVGPAYQDVAAKYADDKQAVAHLVASIRNGGSGRWGDMTMPPQPQVKDADAKKLATWILAGAQ
jgi:cytochrome c